MGLSNWDDARYVLALSRTGSLKDAAEELGVNQSTVYRRVNQCEDELGVRLFERSTHGHRLTPAGELLTRFAEDAAQSLDATMTRLHGHDLRLTGSLHLTSTDTVAHTVVLPALAAFRERYPGIDVHLNIDAHRYDLSRREADIAIRPTASPPPHLSGVCILDETWGVYGVAGEALPSDAGDMQACHAVLGDAELASIPAMKWFESAIRDSNVVLRTGSVACAVEVAVQQRALCLLPTFIGDADSRLEKASIESGHAIQVWLLTHPEIRKAARVRAFFDFFSERFPRATQ